MTAAHVADASPTALELRNLCVTFGGLRAVDRVSMTVPRGQRVAVIGPNGAGKTTLFRAVSGEVKPTSGRIVLHGKDVTADPPHRMAHRGLGRTYQVTNLFPGLTVRENVAIAALGRSRVRFRSWWPIRYDGALGERVDRALTQVGLSTLHSRTVDELSHGEQRQLELALPLASDPQVLLLDEPGAGLSASERHTMKQLIDSLPSGLTVLLIEHDMDLALQLVSWVLCLHNGAVIAEGSPEEIRSNDRVQSVYLGVAT